MLYTYQKIFSVQSSEYAESAQLETESVTSSVTYTSYIDNSRNRAAATSLSSERYNSISGQEDTTSNLTDFINSLSVSTSRRPYEVETSSEKSSTTMTSKSNTSSFCRGRGRGRGAVGRGSPLSSPIGGNISRTFPTTNKTAFRPANINRSYFANHSDESNDRDYNPDNVPRNLNLYQNNNRYNNNFNLNEATLSSYRRQESITRQPSVQSGMLLHQLRQEEFSPIQQSQKLVMHTGVPPQPSLNPHTGAPPQPLNPHSGSPPQRSLNPHSGAPPQHALNPHSGAPPQHPLKPQVLSMQQTTVLKEPTMSTAFIPAHPVMFKQQATLPRPPPNTLEIQPPAMQAPAARYSPSTEIASPNLTPSFNKDLLSNCGIGRGNRREVLPGYLPRRPKCSLKFNEKSDRE